MNNGKRYRSLLCAKNTKNTLRPGKRHGALPERRIMTPFSTDEKANLHRVYRLAELPKFCGLRRTQIAELIKLGQFPRPISLSDGGRAVAWLESDLIAWQHARIAVRNAAAA